MCKIILALVLAITATKEYVDRRDRETTTNLTAIVTAATNTLNVAIGELETGKQDAIEDLETIRTGAALGATALQNYTETDPTVPSWAKAVSKPSYTLNEVAPNSENWLGVQGNAGRTIKILAQGAGSSPAGGVQVTASTLNNNNTTTYAYSGVAVKRNGVNTDYLWDTTSESGIVRRSELATALAAKYEKPSGGIPKSDLAEGVRNLIDGALQKVLPSGSTTIVLPYDDDVRSHFIIKDSAHNPVIDIASTDDDDNYEIMINEYASVVLNFENVYDKKYGLKTNLAGKLESIVELIAPRWKSGTTYDATAKVSYNDVVYARKTSGSITSSTNPASDTTNWEKKKVSELLTFLAPLASPAFTGTPTAPDIGTNTTSQVATKKYVDDKVASAAGGGVTAVSVADGGTFGTGDLADGKVEMWRVTCAGAYTPSSSWHLIGYAAWPAAGSTFQCTVWRIGNAYYCNIIVVE